MKIWNRTNAGTLISVVEVASMEEARQLARQWNRNERRLGMRVDIVANAEKAAEATQVSAVY